MPGLGGSACSWGTVHGGVEIFAFASSKADVHGKLQLFT